jgi:hypothetical protein
MSLAAGRGELHAFLEEGQRFLQGNLSLFEFLNYLLQSLEALFKLGQRIAPYAARLNAPGLSLRRNSELSASSFGYELPSSAAFFTLPGMFHAHSPLRVRTSSKLVVKCPKKAASPISYY